MDRPRGVATQIRKPGGRVGHVGRAAALMVIRRWAACMIATVKRMS
jgi:hypothetical protein